MIFWVPPTPPFPPLARLAPPIALGGLWRVRFEPLRIRGESAIAVLSRALAAAPSAPFEHGGACIVQGNACAAVAGVGGLGQGGTGSAELVARPLVLAPRTCTPGTTGMCARGAIEATPRREFHKKEDRSGDGDTVTVNRFLDLYNMDSLANQTVSELDGAFCPNGTDFSTKVTELNDASQVDAGKLGGKGGIYLVHEASGRLLGDLWLPREYLGFMRTLVRAPVMWMSSGGTSSVLHNDGDDNINCVIDGRKLIVLMNASYEEDVYHGTQWSGYGSRSPVDTSRVDLVKWPRLANVPWYHIELFPGDCVFMPTAWLHAVRAPPGRSIAVNVWFNPALEPDWEAAEREVRDAPDPSPLPQPGSAGEPGMWEDGVSGSWQAAGMDDTWQPERLEASDDESLRARGVPASSRRAGESAPRAADSVRRLPMSSSAWGFNASPGGNTEVADDKLAKFLYRDALWLDRWLDGATTSLVPPWSDEPVPIPPWLEGAVKERLETGSDMPRRDDGEPPEDLPSTRGGEFPEDLDDEDAAEEGGEGYDEDEEAYGEPVY